MREKSKEVISKNAFTNDNNWKAGALILSMRKEVDTKFNLPLLYKLGYSENDRFDTMPVNAAHGFRKTTL